MLPYAIPAIESNLQNTYTTHNTEKKIWIVSSNSAYKSILCTTVKNIN